ncbi:ubiquitin-conjugating enzyme family protein [Rutstroemia sp. NJR-2017a BBW]|nr:ubiquitin-conjugating enzyme family protein [Rutstroemia sp. NJR-2017a BBW]
MSTPAPLLQKRLLSDIHELMTSPYPHIQLFPSSSSLQNACLHLETPIYGLLHLDIVFPASYPLIAPRITIDTTVSHPNVYGSYICASILNQPSEWTPAYTLKGVAIQLLSFFASDRVEQMHGRSGEQGVELRAYGEGRGGDDERAKKRWHACKDCGFGVEVEKELEAGKASQIDRFPPVEDSPHLPGVSMPDMSTMPLDQPSAGMEINPAETPDVEVKGKGIQHMHLPNELILEICKHLHTEELMLFAKAWSRVGRIMTEYDILRTRELVCFCSKKDYTETKLGVGVHVFLQRSQGTITSEFDLLSHEAFANHHVRRSIQGISFQHWLPLPLSFTHWDKVKDMVDVSLSGIATAAKLGDIPPFQVISHFMNDVVVQLNKQASETPSRIPTYSYNPYIKPKSSLTHASEKAIESYFHLFHLLLCLALSSPPIIQSANKTLQDFTNGKTSKTDCPNLGHLLVAALISDVQISVQTINSIIREAITRNVVWMLDKRGADKPELSYIEPSTISEYRLRETFAASRTSYRLLMFLNLFRITARGSPPKALSELCDEAFQRHGAPRVGTTRELAASIKRIHAVDSFPEFMQEMGVPFTTKDEFCTFLKGCITDSISKGYSRMPISQASALYLRRQKEPDVEAAVGLWPQQVNVRNISFFPGKVNAGRAGRGRGRGQVRGQVRGQ